jgi:hypothetical protein
MAVSTLDASLPALEDLITLLDVVPLPKSWPAAHSRYLTRYLPLYELDDYEDEVESIRALALVREMPARCTLSITSDCKRALARNRRNLNTVNHSTAIPH